MKIKTDFVTNSSSTCFTLICRAYGTFPLFFCKNDPPRKDLPYFEQQKAEAKIVQRELKRYFGDKVTLVDPPQYYYTYRYTVAELENPLAETEYASYEEEQDEPKIQLMLSNGILTEDPELVGTLVHFNALTPNMDGYEEKRPHEIILKYIRDIVKAEPVATSGGHINLITTIKEFNGSGGWDGGDPMGKYAFSHDCIANETMVGRIFIKDGDVFPNLRTLGDESDILMDVFETMKVYNGR